MPEADDADPPAGDLGCAECPFERDPDRQADALGGGLRRFAGAALRLREAVRVAGALARDQHVFGRRADVLADAVAPAERVDRVTEVEHRGAPALGGELGVVWSQRDHALAAAEGKSGKRALQGHRL